jgi:Transcriptional regulator/sugar kinase
MHSVGIDIGGTKIAGALVDDAGNIIEELRVKSPITDPGEMVEAIASVINELTSGQKVVGVGVAAAGFLSADREIMFHSPNIAAWRNEPLKSRIQDKTSYPVLLENDANAAGWAEFRFGAGKNVSSMIMLTIGTGVGGAVVTQGQLLKGGFGIGGELGHVVLIPGGRQCGCGLTGCIETYASGTALLKAARDLAESPDSLGDGLRKLNSDPGTLTGEQVYQAIMEDDPGALGLIFELGEKLGIAIGSLFVPVLDPELVVVGGGVSAVGERLLDPMRSGYSKSMPAKGYRPELSIVKAQFLNQAGLIGAADLARLSFS